MTTYHYRLDPDMTCVLEPALVVEKKDEYGRTEKVVLAREAFWGAEALTTLSIILAQADLEDLRRDYAGMGPALDQAARVLKEAAQ